MGALGGDVGLKATGDIVNQSLSVKQEYASVNTSGSYTSLSNQASITATGALGMSAGRDITDTGGTIIAASAVIQAGRDIAFNAIQTGSAYVADVNGNRQNDSSITNKVGQVSTTDDLSLKAGQDIKLSSTQVNLGATGNGTMVAGRDISIAAVVDEVKTHQENDPKSKSYDKIIHENQTVVGATVAAGGNLTIKAGDAGAGGLAIAGSNIAGGGNVSLAASGDVSITQVQENHLSDVAFHRESKSTFKKSSDTTADYSSVSNVIGSNVSGGAVTVKSGNDIVIGGSQLTAENALTLNAGRDLLVSSAAQTGSENHSAEHKKSGFSLDITEGVGYTKSQDNKTGSSNTVTQVGSVLSGGSVSATSGRDTIITGSTVVADKDIVIDAKRDLSIVSAEDSVDSESVTSSKKSGSIGTRFQAAIGTVKTTNDGTAESVTQVGSQIASLGGNVTLKAGGQYTQTSSEVTTPEGDIKIVAKDVLINAANNINNSTDHTTYNKTAIGGTITSPVVEALKSVGSMVKAAEGTGNSRMQALAALNAAANLKDAATSLMAATNAGLRVSISLGNSKSENNVVSTSSTVAGSTIAAGGNVSITATGGGKDSNLTAIGSDITAGGNVALSADNDVSLLAGENTVSQHSTNKSSGASIGIGFGIGGTSNGFTIDLAVSQARGKADGDDIGYTNTHVNAGNNVAVISGGDTTLKGGVIAADSVVADIGGDLNIESLQDSSHFDSKQSSSGLNASLCIPPFCYGASTVGGSISKSKVNGEFLSVLEQSGIKAGDGGFQVTVAGNTDLKGGLLSSSQVAVDEGSNMLMTGSLTASDLQNKDEFSASGFSMSGSVSGTFGNQDIPPEKKLSDEQKAAAAAGGKPTASAGIGSASGSQSSTTFSGISGGLVIITDKKKQDATGKDADAVLAAIDQTVTTESAAANASALTKGWDGQQLQKEVDAQVAITKEFSKQAPKAIASFADQRIADIKVQVRNEKDAIKRDALNKELDKWDEGGAYRTALHTVSGALSGGLNGGFGALASSSAADWMADLQLSAIDVLRQQGLSIEEAHAAAQGVAELASIGLGMAVGGVAGAGTALTVDTNNRQLNTGDKTIAKQLAKESGGRYTEKQLLDALRQAGVKDRSGNVIVQEGTREYFVIIGGQLTDPLTMKPIQDTLNSDGSIILRPESTNPSRSLIEDKPTVPDKELMGYIIASTGGAASPYILTPPKVYTSNANLSPAPEGTHRVSMVVDGNVYFPLVASCPAASCTNGDPIALAVPDDATKAYTEAVSRQVEKQLNIINNRGNLSACASGLSSHAFATAVFSWFEYGSLNDFKKWMYISSRLEKLYYEYQEGSPEWGRGFPNLFKPLFSDNEEIIYWISNYELAYDSSRINDPATLDFLAYQSIVAIRGDWDNLIYRCKLVIENPSAIILKGNKLIDYKFLLALGEGDVAGMEEVIALMISNEKKRADKNGGGYTKDLISSDAAIYSKIAWRSGYFVDVRSPYVPYDWLPVKPLDKYELVYDFLN